MLCYAYMLNAGLLVPNFTTSSTVTVAAVVLCGLQGGLFYAFSTAVMLALARQPHPSGILTMKTVNVVVFNPWFGGAFSLAAVACVLTMITALACWPAPDVGSRVAEIIRPVARFRNDVVVGPVGKRILAGGSRFHCC